MKYDQLVKLGISANIQAIIFDFGNVLIEWNPRRVYRRYFPNDEEAMEKEPPYDPKGVKIKA